MIKNIILLGAPGTGKGTLADKTIKMNGDFIHISTGELFRKEIKNKTNLGKTIEKIVKSGKYVPDEIVNLVIEKNLKKYKEKNIIFDGFPRTINQVMFLEKINVVIDKIILLTARKKIIIQRLLSRNRNDDNINAIKIRLKVYKQETKPVIQYYKNKTNNSFEKLNTNSNAETCFKNFLKVLNKND